MVGRRAGALSFPQWKVGARFVCPRCWVRGASPACRACGEAALDVGGADGYAVLKGRWRAYGAFIRGRALYSLLAAHRLPVVAGLSVTVALATSIAPIVGALARPEHSAAELAIAAAVGLIGAPLVAMFFAAFLVLYANVCRVLAVLTALLPTPFGVGRARVNLAAAIFDWIARGLLAPITLEPETASSPDAEHGTLVEPVTIHLRRDALSFAERFDAWLDGPLTVQIGGTTRQIDFVTGLLSPDPRLAERAPDTSAPLAWADAPSRTGVARVALIPAGARLAISRNWLSITPPKTGLGTPRELIGQPRH